MLSHNVNNGKKYIYKSIKIIILQIKKIKKSQTNILQIAQKHKIESTPPEKGSPSYGCDLNITLHRREKKIQTNENLIVTVPTLFSEELVSCFQNCSDLLWQKIDLEIRIFFFNSRPKAQNLQECWDYLHNSFKHWKISTIFETEYFLKLKKNLIWSKKHAGIVKKGWNNWNNVIIKNRGVGFDHDNVTLSIIIMKLISFSAFC